MRQVLNNKQQVESWMDLDVWKIAHNLALKLYEMTKSFPSEERFRLTDQKFARLRRLSRPTLRRGRDELRLGNIFNFFPLREVLLEEASICSCSPATSTMSLKTPTPRWLISLTK